VASLVETKMSKWRIKCVCNRIIRTYYDETKGEIL